MSYPLQVGPQGFYGVMLHNKKDLTEDQLRVICSKYGEVKNLKITQNGKLAFVDYQEYEEARAFLDELGPDNNFSARVARRKVHTSPSRLRSRARSKSVPGRTQEGDEKKQRSTSPPPRPSLEESESSCTATNRVSNNVDSFDVSTSNDSSPRRSLFDDYNRSYFRRQKLDRIGAGSDWLGHLDTSKNDTSSLLPFTFYSVPHVPTDISRIIMKSSEEIEPRDSYMLKILRRNDPSPLTRVLFANLPLWFMMGDMFALVSMASCYVAHIDFSYSRTPQRPPSAVVHVPSEDDALLLVSEFGNTVVDSKKIIVKLL